LEEKVAEKIFVKDFNFKGKIEMLRNKMPKIKLEAIPFT
jgi:hypothetical protein